MLVSADAQQRHAAPDPPAGRSAPSPDGAAPIRRLVRAGARILRASGAALKRAVRAVRSSRHRDHAILPAAHTSERYFRSLIENALDTITIVDAEGTILYESPSIERVLGYSPNNLIGRRVFGFVHPEEQPAVLARFEHLLENPGTSDSLELRFRHADGSWRTLEVIGRNLLGDPDVGGVVINARDITERKKAERQLRFNAFHDRLTGLPNRALFMDRLSRLIRRAERGRDDTGFAVLFLDVDRFKMINDSLGHAVGDELLVALGGRLETCVRPGDTVARVGGDEFTVLLDDTPCAAAAATVAERIHTALQAPFDLSRHEVFATASIGIAVSDPGYDRAENVLRDADLAMYRAKARGRARHEIFDSAMHAEAVARLELETDLRRALDRDELRIHYQPIVSLATGRITGLEALLRWQHRERGLLHPDDFLDSVEETGLIIPIGWWMIRESCRQFEYWRTDGASDGLGLHINLSATQFSQHDLADRIADVLSATGMPFENVHLELTESVVMDRAEQTIRTLQRLRQLGIRLSIDDFGTGYSSLSYLQRFPTDTLKIDRSFVDSEGSSGDNAAIIRTIVSLAHDLGMHVVAEGIETAAQYRKLWELGCDTGQGFYFSPAVPPDEAGDLLRNEVSW